MEIRKTERFGILVAAVLALFVISLPGTASAKDRNRDRIPDRWERTHKLTLKKDQRKLDQDRDGLRNRGEWLSDTSPRDRDSDDDGVNDLRERAGVISAYDRATGELTLTLYAGGELTASVNSGTEIECDDEGGADEHGTDDEDGADDEHGTDDDADDRDPDEADARRELSGAGGEAHQHHGDGEGRGHDNTDDDDSDDQDSDDGCDSNCSVDDLAVGVEVTEADVRYTASGKVFEELEIVASAK